MQLLDYYLKNNSIGAKTIRKAKNYGITMQNWKIIQLY